MNTFHVNFSLIRTVMLFVAFHFLSANMAFALEKGDLVSYYGQLAVVTELSNHDSKNPSESVDGSKKTAPNKIKKDEQWLTVSFLSVRQLKQVPTSTLRKIDPNLRTKYLAQSSASSQSSPSKTLNSLPTDIGIPINKFLVNFEENKSLVNFQDILNFQQSCRWAQKAIAQTNRNFNKNVFEQVEAFINEHHLSHITTTKALVIEAAFKQRWDIVLSLLIEEKKNLKNIIDTRSSIFDYIAWSSNPKRLNLL